MQTLVENLKRKASPRNRWRRVSRRTRTTLLIIFLVVVVIRLALPFAIEWYVNRQLKRAPQYGGRIGTVYVHLWRGAYRIKDIEVYKKNGKVKEPLFAASVVDLSVEWRELFHGAVVGQVLMEQPRLNFVSGPTKDETQRGEDARWDKILESLFPFNLNRLEVRQGQVHFQNHYSKPPVDIYVTDTFAVATNLTNARDLNTELPSGLSLHGNTLGDGGVNIQLRLNPLADPPAFELVSQLTNVNLVALNDFLKAYGNFDVQRGKFELFTSVAAKDGSYEGYFKTFFEDLDVFDWQKESKKNPLAVAWQAVVGSAASIFKNHNTDKLATKIPIAGKYEKGQVDVLTAVGTLLRNAFISALVPKVDEKVTVQQVEKKTEEKEADQAHAASLPPDAKAAEKTAGK